MVDLIGFDWNRIIQELSEWYQLSKDMYAIVKGLRLPVFDFTKISQQKATTLLSSKKKSLPT